MQFMIKVTKQERKAGPTLKSRLRATSERLSGMTLLDYASRSNTHAEIAELEEELLPGLKQFAMIEECDEDEG
jgi:hemolysin-activating ACP:hemolysin acyltransferase